MPRPRPLVVPAARPLPFGAETLGPPPLIPGEAHAGYETLLVRVTEAVRPDSIVAEAWVRDVVDLIWEAVRLRRLKAALMTASAADGMAVVLNDLTGGLCYKASQQWAARDPKVVADVDYLLSEAGLGLDHVMAQTLRRHIDVIERIDRMAASAEVRRAATLREISHWRASFAATFGAAADAAIADAAYEVVEADGAEVPAAAAAGAAEPAAQAAE